MLLILKKFLELKELGSYLLIDYIEAFNSIFGFIFFIALVMSAAWLLLRIEPLSFIIKSIQQAMSDAFKESALIKELIPNNRLRLHFYRILMWGGTFLMAMSYLWAFCYGSLALAALCFTETLKINQYTGFTILSALTVIMMLSGYYFMKEADKLAKFLNQSRASTV